MDWRLTIALPLTATLLLGSCAEEPPPLEPWSDIALLVASPAEFGPHVRGIVEGALDAAQAAPTRPSTIARLGMVLHAYDKFEGAARCYERALELQPGQFAWLYYLGSVRAELGRHNEALDALRQAVRIDPSYAPARLRLADVLLAAGKVESSRALYAALTRENPTFVHAVYGLGRSLSEIDQHAAAVEQLARAIELAPEYGSAHYALGLAYRDLGDETAALRHVAESERIAGRQPPVDDSLMRAVHALRTDPRSRQNRGYGLQAEGRLLEAIEQFRLAADQGRAAAQNNLGFMYDKGRGVPEDDVEAVRWYRLAADQGQANAQYNLGFMYATGRGVPQDDAEAVRWYRLAADQGNAGAQYNLGVMYANGQGVPEDDAEAVRWYRLAADQGNAGAQLNLGVLYANGDGGVQDDAEAVRWYRLAADQGLAAAQYNLGTRYRLTGRGVARDDAEAARWYRLAADQGHAGAQLNLGVLYANGDGVAQDDVEAYMWLSLAAAQSLDENRDRHVEVRDGFAEFLTAEQTAEAQRRAREWTPEP